MAEVWLGRHGGQRVPVAVKFLPIEVIDDLRRRRRFRNEVRSVSRIRHANIVDIFDYGRVGRKTASASSGRFQPGQPYLVMEFGAGGTLAEVPYPLEWPAVRELVLTLLEALARAHAHEVIHRDIKPTNVLFTADPLDSRLLLSDFGLAYTGDGSISGPNPDRQTRGTPFYMSPEQFREKIQSYGPPTDLYGLGCLTWELVAGAPPFGASNLMRLATRHLRESPPSLECDIEVPEQLESWLHKMLAKRPAGRFQSAAAAACALRSFSEGDDDNDGYDFGRPGLFDDLTSPGTAASPSPSGAHQHVPLGPRSRREREQPRAALRGISLDLVADRRPRMIARERECNRLWAQLCEVDDQQRPGFVLLRGRAGVGKSRLAQWLVERARELGCATGLRARHSSTGDQHDCFAPMIADHLSVADLDPRVRSEAIEDWFAERGVDDPYASQLVASILQTDESTQPLGNDADQRDIRTLDRLFAATTQFLDAATQRGPVVIHLDNLHWSDLSSRFIRHAFDRLEESPILFVGTAERPAHELDEDSEIAELLERPESAELTVEPLDAEHHRRLIEYLVDFEPELREELAKRTSGNPRLAVEAVRECIEREDFVDDGSEFRLAEDAELPDCSSLRSLFAERLETVLAPYDEGATRSLEIAAALGRVVDWSEWKYALRRAGLELPSELLETLFRKRFAEDFGCSWAFAQPMLRETLVRRARKSGRWREIHRICADAIDATGPGTDPITVHRFAYHARESGALRRAADRLIEALHDTRFLGAAETHGFLLERLVAIMEGLELDEDDPRRGLYFNHLGRGLLGGHCDSDRVREYFERGLELAEDHRWPDIAAEALEGLGRTAHFQHEFERANRCYREALDRYSEAIDAELESRIQRARAGAFLQLGDFGGARNALDRALESAPDGSVTRANALHRTGRLLLEADRFEEAETVLSEALEIFEQRGLLYGVGHVLNTLGDVSRRRGELAAAASLYNRAARIADSTRIADLEHVFLSRVQVALEQRQYEVGARRLERARDSSKIRNAELFKLIHLTFEAWCAAGLGDWERSQRAWSQFRETPADAVPHDPDINAALRQLRDLAREAGRDAYADRIEERIAATIREEAAE